MGLHKGNRAILEFDTIGAKEQVQMLLEAKEQVQSSQRLSVINKFQLWQEAVGSSGNCLLNTHLLQEQGNAGQVTPYTVFQDVWNLFLLK